MKIAIMSDSHDHWENLTKAVDIANTKSCKYLLFSGDLIAPTGLEILSKFKGKVKLVFGNNEGEIAGLVLNAENIQNLEIPKRDKHQINRGALWEEEINGLNFFMNHYPRIAEIAAHSGLFDVVIYGHNHTYNHSTIKNCLYLNPGEVHGSKTNTPSFMVLDTNTKNVEKITIS